MSIVVKIIICQMERALAAYVVVYDRDAASNFYKFFELVIRKTKIEEENLPSFEIFGYRIWVVHGDVLGLGS